MKKKKVSAKKSAPKRAAKVGGTARGKARGRTRVIWPNVGRRKNRGGDPVAVLADAIKATREEQKVSLASLGKSLDVAPATLIKFEDRSHPLSVAIVLRMAEELGYSLVLKKNTKRKK